MRSWPDFHPWLSAFALFLSILACTSAPAQPQPNAPQDHAPTPTAAPNPEMAEAQKAFESKDWPAAIKAYDAITKADPKNLRALFMLGLSRHSKGEHAAAIEDYRRAAESPQLKPLCQYNTACALALLDRPDQAFTELDLAVEGGFRNLKQLDEDPDLERLRADARFPTLRRRVAPIQDLVKELDFWVGEWVVENPQGQQVGTSTIEKVERGALILEHWSNTTGGTGQSMNFVDPATRRWHQIWVDPSGSVVRYEGALRDGALHLEGTNQPPVGKPKLTRMSLTPQKDSTVRQFIEHSTDQGATWTTYFDGIYRRKPAPTPNT